MMFGVRGSEHEGAPLMILRTATLAALAFALLGGPALAQLGPKSPLGKPKTPFKNGGKFDPESDGKKSRIRERESVDTGGPKDVTIAPGDRVDGRAGFGVTHRVRFFGVSGARITLRLESRDEDATATAVLRDPDGDEVAALDPVDRKPGSYLLDDFELPASGEYALEIALDGGESGDYRLETSVAYPRPEPEVLSFEHGRPRRILLSGMPGRRLIELKLRAEDVRDGLDFSARLFDPDGVSVDLDPYLRTGAGGSALFLRDLPLEMPGDYELFIADKARVEGSARLTIRFSNPPAGKARIRL